MESVRNRYLILVALLAIMAIVAYSVSYKTYPYAEKGVLSLTNIPKHIEGYEGKDLPLEESVYELLETRAIMHRIYESGNSRNVFVSIVHYPETKVDFHAPESCLGGQGIEISKSRKSVKIIQGNEEIRINMNQLIWEWENEKVLVYYFYKTGEYLDESYIRLRLNLIINKVRNVRKSGSLIRLSTPINSDNIQEASIILENFLTALYPFLLRNL